MPKEQDPIRPEPTPPATSELPVDEPLSESREVNPHPATAGGLTNIPGEALSPAEKLQDEIDHAGLDQELPGEEQARTATQQQARSHPEKWSGINP